MLHKLQNAAPAAGILSSKSGFEQLESYQMLRTNLLFSLPQAGCKKLLVTCAGAGEGKSTVCVNLGMTFARTGSNTLLVDCDLRSPSLHRYLGLSGKLGLSSLLAGMAKLDECLVATPAEHLALLPAGILPPNPLALLESPVMPALLADLEKRFDCILFDTPPAALLPDALAVAKQAHGALFVVRQGESRYGEINKALQALARAQVEALGFVLTGSRAQSRRYHRYSAYYGAR